MLRISAKVFDASLSMIAKRIERSGGILHADHSPGLRLDGDRRHVVRDGVVQLAGEELAFGDLDLLVCEIAPLKQVADLGTEHGREEQHDRTADRIADPGPVDHESRRQGRRHHDQPVCAMPTRGPAEEGVDVDEEERRRERLDRFALDDPRHLVEHDEGAHRDGRHRERELPSPQQREAEQRDCHHRPGTPHQLLAE